MTDKLIYGPDSITTLKQSPKSLVDPKPIVHKEVKEVKEVFYKVSNLHLSSKDIMGVTYTIYADGSRHESKVKLYPDYENSDSIEENQ